RSSVRRVDGPSQLEPRLAKPGRLVGGDARGDSERHPGPRRDRVMDRVRTGAGDYRAPCPLLRRVRGGVRRLRQGALAAVPDLAAAARAARARAAWACRFGRARRCARADAALVPVSLLAPGAAAGCDRDVARVRARPRPGLAGRDPRHASTRTGSHAVATPSAPHSISTPSIQTPPSAGLKRTGIPVRMRAIARSAWTPITESCGPVMPASLIAAVPPG